ncbi:unnamed protein product [Cyprideis torosa]|uniref:Multiple inositol polyphosphate phosphatase 1 n=1 Tax=Cyprideis torosa TaxID=163714 RepID=A0A7R8WK25_9CRUS|nr:unnamed protein product [Cyprideis torosa]CAG0895613.1 unnamed protein product [Cyprideis torosa]
MALIVRWKASPVSSLLVALLCLYNDAGAQRGRGLPPPDLPYLGFNTKTSYFFAERASEPTPITTPGCRPAFFWFYGRHGARYPYEHVINAMQEILPELQEETLLQHARGQGALSPDALMALRRWSMPYGPQDALEHAPVGFTEVMTVGKRYGIRLPEIFRNATSQNILVSVTDTNRAADSGVAFLQGVYGQNHANDFVILRGHEDADLIRWPYWCRNYQIIYNRNPEVLTQRFRFTRSPEMRRLIYRVQRRMGLTRALSFDEMLLMYDVCRFDVAINPFISQPARAWCPLFHREDLEILEYLDDIQRYWKHGYGFPKQFQPSCVLIRNFAEHLRALRNGNSPVRARIMFSHQGEMLKLYAALGLFRDPQPFLATNYRANRNRRFNATKIMPFAANFALLVERCGPGRLNIRAFVNELEVRIPRLDAANGDFFAAFRNEIQNCDLQDFCQNSGLGQN